MLFALEVILGSLAVRHLSAVVLASIAVAMFSVRSEIRDKVHGLQEGALDYITKPFSVEDLTSRVAALLRRRGVQAPGAEAR